jgi:N-carbamoylputrescine amidase
MTELTVAALQLGFSDDLDENIANVSALVREAAGRGAKVVLPPELFEGLYFCRTQDEGLFVNARPTAQHPAVLAMQKLAAELEIFIPTSFFEAEVRGGRAASLQQPGDDRRVRRDHGRLSQKPHSRRARL